MEPTPANAEEPELFGTETMAELCARQGRPGEAIKIYQRLLAQNPPADKSARWTERCRALERARAHAPDLNLEALPPPRPQAPRPQAPVAAKPQAPAPQAPAPAPDPADAIDITEVTAVTAMPEVPAAVPVPETPVSVMVEEPHRLPLVITQPVRSGQVVYAKHNDLIVLGPVNSGGQVVADGNIHIYGALRGRAIAGAAGATEARIFCQRLEAELLAISGIYLIWDEIPRPNLGKAAQICLRGDVCVVAAL